MLHPGLANKCQRNFQALGFNELFDCVVISEAVNLGKPDKKIFEHACCKVDADINHSIFIGDNPVADIQGAKNADMTTIYVPIDPNHEPCSDADSSGQLKGLSSADNH